MGGEPGAGAVGELALVTRVRVRGAGRVRLGTAATFVGTAQTSLELEQIGPATSETDAKKKILEAIRRAAAKLGNKPSTCRNYYVHPAVLESYADGRLFEAMKKVPQESGPFGLRREELCVLQLVMAHDTGRALLDKAA